MLPSLAPDIAFYLISYVQVVLQYLLPVINHSNIPLHLIIFNWYCRLVLFSFTHSLSSGNHELYLPSYFQLLVLFTCLLRRLLDFCILLRSVQTHPRHSNRFKRPWHRKPHLPRLSQEPEHRKKRRIKENFVPLHPWRYLHIIGDHFATEFEHLLTLNDALWELIRPDHQLLTTSQHRKNTIPLPFCLHGTSYDLTSLVQADDLFRFQSVYHFKSDNGLPLIFDTGASITVTPHLSDFINSSVETDPSKMRISRLNGISSSHVIKGIGKIKVLVYTDDGKPRYLITTGYYVPDIKVRLLSVQRYLDEHKGESCSFVLNDNGMKFQFPSSTGGGTLTFEYKDSNYLPSADTYLSEASHQSPHCFTVIDESNTNLTTGQKALLKVHFRLGHFNLRWIQHLIRHGFVKSFDDEQALKCDSSLCICAACQFSKQRRKPTEAVKHTIVPANDGNLTKNNLRPGGSVSTDQFVSSVPGRLATSFGKEQAHEMMTGGTVFVDDASGYFHVENQVSLSAPETIRSKRRFERMALQGGVPILGYRGDNGIYRSHEFSNELARLGQTIQFSGVGAHHQNGIAERAIRTITNSARSMLLHAMIHWPGQVDLNLWPFAVEYAVYLWNHIPRMDSNLSPAEVFFSSHAEKSVLPEAKCWGCPAYVLDPTIQDGKKLPRWNPRSKLGQFLGRSREHGDTVGRIRNLRTGAITAQFHVVYDNYFSSVTSDISHDNIPCPPNFHDLLRYSTENFYDPSDLRNATIHKRQQQLDSLPPPASESREKQPSSSIRLPSSPLKDTPLPSPRESISDLRESARAPMPNDTNDSSDLREFEPAPSPLREESSPPPSPAPRESPSPVASSPSPMLRRSTRSTKGTRTTDRYSAEYQGDYYLSFAPSSDAYDFYDAFLLETDFHKADAMTSQYDVLHSLKLDLDDDDIILAQHPLAFSARANAEDTPRWHEAMRSPDRQGFLDAMDNEMEQLIKMNAFVKVPRQKAIDEGKPIIDSTWAFRRKRYPDGSVKKLKARLCVRGDQMTDLNPFDTYSPVVAWSTIRLLLVLSILLNLKTVQVDYTNAFVQAKAEPGTYIEMPRAYQEKGFIYELKRNLYGQRDAPIKFFEHLKTGLEQRGFSQSANDRCLFISKNVLVLTYVDDCIFFSREQSHIDKLIEDLRDPTNKTHIPFTLNVESNYEGFLGIDINPSKHVEGALELLQTGLIDRILGALNLDHENVSERDEPAISTPLGKDESGRARTEDWSYPSVIGMMLYLASNSRPDIAFAVHQCARFNHCPRAIHEKAVKHIARYLKRTRDRGLVMNPNDQFALEMFADADFAGLWNAEEAHDPISVKSRTGYIITLSSVPVLWCSKLQTEIATSTMHAEYIALSSGMRELLPVANVFNDVCDGLNVTRSEESRIIKTFEDNEGAQKLASSPITRVTPHSKHFAIKYHWFREKLDEYNIEIHRVGTDMQKADIFTKGLIGKEFRHKRSLLMNW